MQNFVKTVCNFNRSCPVDVFVRIQVYQSAGGALSVLIQSNKANIKSGNLSNS